MNEERRLTNQEHFDLWDEELIRWVRSRRSSWGGITILTIMLSTTVLAGVVIFLYGFNILH